MDIWKKLKKLSGYQSGDGGVDSYGVDHSGFSTRDELEYQNARLTRENQLAENFAEQGIAEENYPQYGTNFWGQTAENNYGFGASNISQNVQDVTNRLNSMATQNNNEQQLQMPAGSEQQLIMPSYELQQKLQQPQTSTWDKIKNAANNFADATQAATVGYATGASLGNFDEAMGTATAAVTGNTNNYTLGRDATRRLQNNLQKQHPYVYGGAEMLGAAQSPMHFVKDKTFANRVLNAATDTMNASIGYSQNWSDFGTNLVANGLANSIGLAAEYLPGGRALGVIGRKALTQGANYLTNKTKDALLYNNKESDDEDDEEKYYYWK